MITVTDSALKRMKDLLLVNPGVIGFRFGVKGAGCSGLFHVLELIKEIKERNNVVYAFEGVLINVPEESASFVEGTEIDCVKDLLSDKFKFNNPNAKSECGCGESFTV